MNLRNKSELEKYFADHFDTVLFPVLADIYMSEGDLTRARKVCEIGLEYHPNNVDGSFVLAEINQSAGDLNVAEKLLKNVIASEPYHYKAVLGLAKIQLKLKRAPDSIAKLWMKIAKIDPTHPEVKKYLKSSSIQKKDSSLDKEFIESKKLKKEFEKLNQKNDKTSTSSPKEKPKKSSLLKTDTESKTKVQKTPTPDPHESVQTEEKIIGPKPPSIKPQKINEEEFQSLDISPRMATFTMVNVLKKQKLYQQAIAVLSLLEEKGADPALIIQERQNLEKLIKDNKPR